MRCLIFIWFALSIIFSQSCRDKDPEPVQRPSLLMMEYFVNYEVGTKWIYQDTINKNNFDTVELVSKDKFQTIPGNGKQKEEFSLFYKAKKSQDFTVHVAPGVDNTCYIKINPLVAGAGAVIFENYNGTWGAGTKYFDSITLNGNKYFHVISSQSSSDYHASVHISRGKGLVFFSRMKGGAILADYKLIKTVLP